VNNRSLKDSDRSFSCQRAIVGLLPTMSGNGSTVRESRYAELGADQENYVETEIALTITAASAILLP
jgi:hypothetical protein